MRMNDSRIPLLLVVMLLGAVSTVGTDRLLGLHSMNTLGWVPFFHKLVYMFWGGIITQVALRYSVTHKYKGWHLNDSKDYDVPIRCKQCKTQTPIKDCSPRGAIGYTGDGVAAPIFKLLCPKCRIWLGTLDESDLYLKMGLVPFLFLQEENAELIRKST